VAPAVSRRAAECLISAAKIDELLFALPTSDDTGPARTVSRQFSWRSCRSQITCTMGMLYTYASWIPQPEGWAADTALQGGFAP